MKRGLLVICLLLVLLSIHAQGLRFRGNSFPIADRTSYTVFRDLTPTFAGRLSISFDLQVNEHQTGYILRIKNDEKGKIFNLSYEHVQGSILFKINEEGKNNLISASLDWNKTSERKWQKIALDFDLQQDSLYFTVNQDKHRAGGMDLPDKWTPKIYFGRSDHMVDVPSFAIRNLLIRDAKQEYLFPLREVSGAEVYTDQGKLAGTVGNPVWLINDFYYWSFKQQFESTTTVACANYNDRTQEVLFLTPDSLHIYNTRTGVVSSGGYTSPCPISFDLGTNFIDKSRNRIYVYDPYMDQADGKIACLDLSTRTWHCSMTSPFERQIHHHAGYFDEAKDRYTLFGGFGNRRYSDDFFSYSPLNNHWEKLSFTGDPLYPRYFVSMGHNPVDSLLYIFGGMGNESGDQYVGRVYFYDLYQVDVEKHTIRKLWEIPWEKEDVVPVRGMVMVDHEYFYTLCYPESLSASRLKLYRFSLKDGSHEILGDSIPIRSDKIKTNANLYYDAETEELCALIQEFDNEDKGSVLKVYTLSFPPVSKDGLDAMEHITGQGGERGMLWWVWIVLLLAGALAVIVAVIDLFWIKRRNRAKSRRQMVKTNKVGRERWASNEQSDSSQTSPSSPESPNPSVELPAVPAPVLNGRLEERKNAIYLFGEFTVKDRDGKDISYMFSTQLRQLFVLILHASFRDGISSQQLSEVFWPDKSEEKVKNSRGVALNHLRRTLSELDGVSLVFEKKMFRIIFEEDCYCDYVDCMRMLHENDPARDRNDFMRIIARGKFLKTMDSPLLDACKEQVEYTIEAALTLEIQQCFAEQQYHATLLLAEAIFHIDPVNELAFRYQLLSLARMKKHDEARKKYLQFAVEYKKNMGEEYPKSYFELLNDADYQK